MKTETIWREAKVDDIPLDGKVRIRVSDDVLEPEDWPVWELVISGGIVVDMREVQPGCYRPPDCGGWTREQLAEWTRVGEDGRQPEQSYHDMEFEVPKVKCAACWDTGHIEDRCRDTFEVVVRMCWCTKKRLGLPLDKDYIHRSDGTSDVVELDEIYGKDPAPSVPDTNEIKTLKFTAIGFKKENEE